MDQQAGPVSPDGRWRWDGSQWIPTGAPAQAPVGAGAGAGGVSQPGPSGWAAPGGQDGSPGGLTTGPKRGALALKVIGFVVLGLVVAFTVFAVAVSDDYSEDSLAGPMTSFELAIATRYTEDLAGFLPGRPEDVTIRCPDGVEYDTVGVFVCDSTAPAFGGDPGEVAVIPLEVEVVDGRVAVRGAAGSEGPDCGRPLCITGGSSGD